MKPTLKIAYLALTALALTAGLSACGEKSENGAPSARRSLTLMLDYLPNADHVGIYQAQAEGDFSAAGLNVHVQAPSDPALPLRLLVAGKADVAISYEPEVMLARDRGEPIVSIGAIVQKPLTSIISVGSKHIHTPADLRGKRIGYAGIPYQRAYLKTILGGAGVPASSVTETNVGFNLVPAMVSGKVDATIGGYWNYEALQLAQAHKKPNVIRMESVGVPTYDELVLVVTRKTLATRTDQLRQLIGGLTRGYESARRDPAAAVHSLVLANPGLDESFQLASVKATLGAFFPPNPAHPWGWQDSTLWNNYGNWMLSQHLIFGVQAVANASTNELLAGQGPPGAGVLGPGS